MGLVAHILVGKYEDALPFYRQEKYLTVWALNSTLKHVRLGHQGCGKSQPVLELLHQQLLSGPLVNIDETPVQVPKELDPIQANLYVGI
ncbi:MAG: transposase [Desulfobacterales bacterium]